MPTTKPAHVAPVWKFGKAKFPQPPLYQAQRATPRRRVAAPPQPCCSGHAINVRRAMAFRICPGLPPRPSCDAPSPSHVGRSRRRLTTLGPRGERLADDGEGGAASGRRREPMLRVHAMSPCYESMRNADGETAAPSRCLSTAPPAAPPPSSRCRRRYSTSTSFVSGMIRSSRAEPKASERASDASSVDGRSHIPSPSLVAVKRRQILTEEQRRDAPATLPSPLEVPHAHVHAAPRFRREDDVMTRDVTRASAEMTM